MSDINTPYAIVFYKTHIDFFERKQEGYWALKDRFETEFLDDSEIAPKFSQKSMEWQISSKEVSCWLPDELFQKFMLEEPVTDAQILREYQQDTGRHDDEIVALTREIPSRPGSVQCVALKRIDFDETVVFLRANGFEVVSMAISPGTDSFPSPQIYEIQTLRDIAPTPNEVAPVAAAPLPEQAAEAAVAAAVIAQPTPTTTHVESPPAASTKEPPDTEPKAAASTALVASSGSGGKKFSKRAMLSLVALVAVVAAFAGSMQLIGSGDASPTAQNDQAISTESASATSTQDDATASDALLPEQVESEENSEAVDFASQDNPATDFPEPLGFDDTEGETPEDVATAETLEDTNQEAASAPSSNNAELEPSPFEVDIASIPNSNANTSGEDVVVVESAPNFSTPDRPANQSDISIGGDEASMEVPPARNSTQIQIIAKKLEAQAARNPNASGATEQIATFRDSVALNEISLLGIFGQTNKPSAMIRSSGGRVQTVNVGESVDGWAIIAISRNEVIVKKGSSQLRLQVPN